MKKIIFILYSLVMLIFMGCDPAIEDNKRIIIEGNIIDLDGNPLEDIEIRSRVEQYDLGVTKTNTKGDFKMVSLESYDNDFVIEINKDFKASYSSLNIIRELDNNYPLKNTIGTITLQPVSNVKISINKTSNTQEKLEVNVTYMKAECLYYLDEFLEEDPYDCLNLINQRRTINLTQPNITINVKTIKNHPFKVSYQLGDANETVVELIPNKENFDYEINY